MQNTLKINTHRHRRQIEIAFWDLVIRLMTESKALQIIIRSILLTLRRKSIQMTAVLLTLMSIFACTTLGFYYLTNMGHNRLPAFLTFPTSKNESNPESHQKNIVIVHVDDLGAMNPVVKSVWILFMNTSEPPSLMFKPIFPKNSSLINEDLRLNEKFKSVIIAYLKQIEINWEGMVFLDDQTLAKYISYESAQETHFQNNPKNKIDISLQAVFSEQQIYLQACQHLSNPLSQKTLESTWERNKMEQNFETDINQDTLKKIWETITQSSTPLHCEVLN